jgi:peptide/nickel transport system substrate-binding protein
MWGHNDKVARYEYDPQKARQLLQEVRYRSARRPRLYVSSDPRPYLPSPALVARMVARNLADVGMPVQVVVLPFNEYLRAIQDGKHDLCLAGWTGDTWDPDNFLYTLLDSDNARRGAARNHAMYRNRQVHELLAAARQEHQRSIRQQLYIRAQEIIADEAPWVPLAHPIVDLASQSSVRRLMATSSMAISYRDVLKSPRRAGP